MQSLQAAGERGEELNNEDYHARKRLLLTESQDMSKEQLLDSLSKFCSSRFMVDALLTHNQKRRSSERLYSRASFC